jgi:hypothetical protein
VAPKIGERIYDGACGSAGFLCEAFDYLSAQPNLTTDDLKTLQTRTFYGKEKKSLAYVIAIMNMILHGIEAPNIVHTNTLAENLADIQEKDRYDVILANPPFGGKERKEVQQNFPIKHRRDGLPVPAALHQVAEGRRPGGHRHQEHLPEQHRQRQRQPAQAAAGKLQPAHRAGLPRRHLPGRGREDRGAVLREGRAHAQGLVLPARPRPQHGQDQPAERRDLAEFVELQKTFADISDSEKSKFRLIKGDILFSHINSPIHVGKTAVFDADEDVYHGVNLLLMRPTAEISSAYLELFLKYLFDTGYWRSTCKQSVNQASVNQQDISRVPIAFPASHTEQQRIVAILDEAFEGIATAKANAERNLRNTREVFASHLEQVLSRRQSHWGDIKLGALCQVKTGKK